MLFVSPGMRGNDGVTGRNVHRWILDAEWP